MLKRLYLANGTLQTPLSKTADDIAVDSVLGTYLLDTLSIGDWGYLAVEWYGCVEIIKVYVDYTGLNVSRGQDNTARRAFPSGASVKYTLTKAEIRDATEVSTVNLYADGANPLTVSGSTGLWIVNYPSVNAETVGGIQAYFTDDDATLHLDSYYPPAGCLSIAGVSAPLIGGPYFYLTSQPYPLEATEWMSPNPNRNKPNEQSTFGMGDIWLLTQPTVIDGMLQGNGDIVSINVFGSEYTQSITEEYLAPLGMSILDANTYGTEGSYTSQESSMLQSNCYILQGLLYGSEVTYTYGSENYMRGYIAINSGTLS